MNTQKWYESVTFWTVIVILVLLLVAGIVQMVSPTIPKWTAVVLTIVGSLYMIARQWIASVNPTAPVLAPAASNTLAGIAAFLAIAYSVLKAQNINFPDAVWVCMEGILGVFGISNGIKTAQILKANNNVNVSNGDPK